MGIWYLLGSLLILWLWQEMYLTATVRTIPYSRFKTLLAQGRVIDCQVDETEITGKSRGKPPPEIDEAEKPEPGKAGGSASQPKPAAPGKSEENNPAPAPAPAAEKPTPTGSSSKPPEPVTPPPPTNEKPTTATPAAPPPTASNATAKGAETKPAETKPADGKSPPAAATAKPAEEDTFLFRTVRVEDPQLVAELEAHHVKFEGVKQGFLSNLFLAWVLPLGIMFLIWSFLFRRLGAAGQAVMRIGKTNARLTADKETGVTFADVAGCDEAKYELRRSRRLSQEPEALRRAGGQDSQRRAADRPAGHRQDAAGPRRGGRGPRAVLLAQRQRVRRDVRGRGRVAGARSV